MAGARGIPGAPPLVTPRRQRPAATSDERSLVRAAQRGSPEAIEALVRHHWSDVHRSAYLIVQDAGAAEDIAQEAMLAAVEAIDRFDRRRPIGPWLHRIAGNRALDWLRARSRRPEVSMAEPGSGTASETAAELCGSEQLSDGLLRALASLEPQERALIVLHHLAGFRAIEIGRALNLPSGTVRSRIHRALEHLRAALEDPRVEVDEG